MIKEYLRVLGWGSGLAVVTLIYACLSICIFTALLSGSIHPFDALLLWGVWLLALWGMLVGAFIIRIGILDCISRLKELKNGF